jgi:small basic protein (TIGR04137 family)
MRHLRRAEQSVVSELDLKNFSDDVLCPLNFRGSNPMSQHRSLKGASTIAAKRNVLKRFERVELLKKRGQWKAGRKVLGLPKTKPDV